MPEENVTRDLPEQQQAAQKRSKAFKRLIWLILIFLFFCWPFINHFSANWMGEIQPGIQTNTHIPSNFSMPSIVTIYNDQYFRWAGKVVAGTFVTWGPITIEQKEIPVGGIQGPRPPCTLYGNIREATGSGINLLIFTEENYQAWRQGKKGVLYRALNAVRDYDYNLDISYGRQYIVLDNRQNPNDTYVGFTGVQVYSRPLEPGESPSTPPNRLRCVWNMKYEMLTLYQYIKTFFTESGIGPVTPPSVN
jgi:hypothetical protein